MVKTYKTFRIVLELELTEYTAQRNMKHLDTFKILLFYAILSTVIVNDITNSLKK